MFALLLSLARYAPRLTPTGAPGVLTIQVCMSLSSAQSAQARSCTLGFSPASQPCATRLTNKRHVANAKPSKADISSGIPPT